MIGAALSLRDRTAYESLWCPADAGRQLTHLFLKGPPELPSLCFCVFEIVRFRARLRYYKLILVTLFRHINLTCVSVSMLCLRNI